jgi:hypothetical protein
MARDVDLLNAIEQSDDLRRKSTLETWLTENHDAFAARLSQRIADWAVLCELFKQAGLTDRSGRPPKPETARHTWMRVRAKVKRKRDEQAAKPAPLPPSTVRPVAKPAQPPPTQTDEILKQMTNRGAGLPDPIT